MSRLARRWAEPARAEVLVEVELPAHRAALFEDGRSYTLAHGRDRYVGCTVRERRDLGDGRAALGFAYRRKEEA